MPVTYSDFLSMRLSQGQYANSAQMCFKPLWQVYGGSVLPGRRPRRNGRSQLDPPGPLGRDFPRKKLSYEETRREEEEEEEEEAEEDEPNDEEEEEGGEEEEDKEEE